jgi:uroporphyrinogen III methyltransferase/synthase
MITAHRQNGEAPEIDYKSLVSLKGTLIFLMGIGTLETVTTGLLASGMRGNTPAALIENGTRANQRKLVSTLTDIAGRGKTEKFAPPSILIIGEVCTLNEKLDWFSDLPLTGVKIIVTRPDTRSRLSQKLRELGADVINFPCIRIETLTIPETVFKKLCLYNWLVFSSPAGTEIFIEKLKKHKIDVRTLSGVKIAAVGEKTARVFSEKGIYADYIPEKYSAQELGAGIPYTEGDRVLLFRAEAGTPRLSAALQDRGFIVDDVPVYRTIRANKGSVQGQQILKRGEVEFIAFTSASTVQGFTAAIANTGFDRNGPKAVCIGEETANEAQKHGYKAIISKQATIESMIEKILKEKGES